MKNIFSLICFILFCQAVFSQTNYPLFEDPINVVQYQLKNGLTVVLSENHDKPTVMGTVIVKAGGKNDPSDATGMAHYLEHMLFKGTQSLGTTNFKEEKIYLDKIDSLYESLGKTSNSEQRLSIQKQINEQSKLAGQYAIPNEMDRMLSEIGGQNVNAFTSNDMTVYHNEFPANKMEEWLSIYSHRFVNPVFRLFQSELETVYEEKNRGNESPINYAFETFMKKFYKKHPYGTQSIIGETEHLKNPSLIKMYEFFDKYYVANNMVLCMVGDFKTEEIKPLIEQYFSNWRTGEIPSFPNYPEDDFKPGESTTIAVTPVKMFARGYRTPKFGSYDALMMEIVANILNNDQNSGLFNQLVSNGELMALEAIPMTMEDYGATIFFAVPKIIGQSFEDANSVLDKAIQKLINGDFEDKLFEGAKNEWIRNFETELEDSRERALLLVEVYGNNQNWYEYLNYAKAVKEVNKQQIVEVAKQYFSKNYYTLYSKMGKHTTEKLSKPAYDPIIPNNETHSDFYNEWAEIKSSANPKEIISFKDHIRFETLENGSSLKMTTNPINEIFDLDIVWEAGYRQHPELEMLATILNSTSSPNYELNAFRNELYALGTTINWSAGDHAFILSVSGLDKNLEASMELVYELIQSPVIKDSQLKTISQQIKTSRKMETNEVQMLSTVLREYTLYGNQSKYVRQSSVSDYKKMKAETFNELYSTLKNYKIHVNYTGKITPEILKPILNNLKLQNGQESSDNFVYSYSSSNEKVFFLDNKKSVQSHITFIGIGSDFNKNQTLSKEAFNFYFGYDMSSILFQEIREFRSLAYSTYGFIRNGRNEKNQNVFVSYVGCQGDKSPEALELLYSLIKNMPVKEERSKSVVNSIKNSIESSNPGFREYNEKYEESVLEGYKDNMNLELAGQLPSLEFKNLVDFYKKEVQPIDLKLSIVGNSKKFDSSILNKYGKTTKVKTKKIYNF
ncbi:MAG: insulinase family protein [Flavobacteriia bacterium]|nr:insulinase family protein [Flavobacteriia bacterium]OJX34993.1 MAG: hypothetical protein BGO87_09665 [Flavobacteriia bacterium 40-80]